MTAIMGVEISGDCGLPWAQRLHAGRFVTDAKKRLARVAARHPRLARRRWFLAQGAMMLLAGALLAKKSLRRSMTGTARGDAPPVRPPTASADDEKFQTACIRCGLCGTVCENGCIRYFGLDEVEHGPLTPYLDVRRRSCTLCMRCTNICPTGALTPVAAELETIEKTVRMGRAVVDPEHCISYLGRLCGYCHDACPIPQVAIKLMPPALPVVLDGCVGCGRCVEYCPQNPTAIIVERRTA